MVFFGNLDVAIVEAVAINEDGGIIPTTSVGISPQAVANADIVIVEINSTHPKELEGCHDICMVKNPPFSEAIPLTEPGERIGGTYIPCDPSKITAIVECDIPDNVRPFGPGDEDLKNPLVAYHRFF